jgi:hypothetical protein
MFYSNLGKLEWLKRNTFLFFKQEPFFYFFLLLIIKRIIHMKIIINVSLNINRNTDERSSAWSQQQYEIHL